MISQLQFEVIFQQQFTGHLRLSAGSSELLTVVSIKFSTAVRQAQQAPMSYSSAVENFRFSTTDYCAVELASAAKLT